MTELVIISWLNDSPSIWSWMIPVIVWWGITLLGSLIVQYLQYHFGKKSKTLEEKHKLFSELSGLKLARHQFMYFYGEALIHSNYYEHKHKLTTDKFYFDEALRLAKKMEDFSVEVTKIQQTLLEKLWLASVLFSEISWIHNLIQEISFKSFKIDPPSELLGAKEIEDYKNNACAWLDLLIKTNCTDKLENLLIKIKSILING